MKKRILPTVLALAMCLALLPQTTLAASYTSTKLNIRTEVVSNVNGYARTGVGNEYDYIDWSNSLIDSTGKTVHTFSQTPIITGDGYYYLYNELYDSNFNLVMEFDPYEAVHGEPRATWSFGGMGYSSFDIIANGGVIAIINEPLVLLDYSGNVTGRYMPDEPLRIDPYAAGAGVNIGLDGLITLWQGLP